MPFFKSPGERKLWLCALAVLIAIYPIVGLSRILSAGLQDRWLLSDGIWLGIFLVAATVVAHGLRLRPKKIELAVWLGIAAVYFFILIRMAIPEERSHIVEYGVLAVFIHEALRESKNSGVYIAAPAIMTIMAATVLGIIDEYILSIIPQRVFDPVDMVFNAFAGLLAIVCSLLLTWIRNLIYK